MSNLFSMRTSPALDRSPAPEYRSHRNSLQVLSVYPTQTNGTLYDAVEVHHLCDEPPSTLHLRVANPSLLQKLLSGLKSMRTMWLNLWWYVKAAKN